MEPVFIWASLPPHRPPHFGAVISAASSYSWLSQLKASAVLWEMPLLPNLWICRKQYGLSCGLCVHWGLLYGVCFVFSFSECHASTNLLWKQENGMCVVANFPYAHSYLNFSGNAASSWQLSLSSQEVHQLFCEALLLIGGGSRWAKGSIW